MTQSAWPVSGKTVSEAQFRAWARQAFGTRIYQGLTVSTSTTGRQLTVSAGLATVDGCAYMSDSAVTLDVDANTTGQARRVYAVLRLDPTADPMIQLATVNGPAGGGAASFTQTDTGVYEFPLGYATVTAGQSGGWSSATSAVTMIAAPSTQQASIAQSISWVDVNASGNPRILVQILYEPVSGMVSIIMEPTGNITGLKGGGTWGLGTIASALRPPAALGLSLIHISSQQNDEVYISSDGSITLKTANATSASTSHYPRGSISYPARGGRNMADFG